MNPDDRPTSSELLMVRLHEQCFGCFLMLEQHPFLEDACRPIDVAPLVEFTLKCVMEDAEEDEEYGIESGEY